MFSLLEQAIGGAADFARYSRATRHGPDFIVQNGKYYLPLKIF
jgi:hypothetical protein